MCDKFGVNFDKIVSDETSLSYLSHFLNIFANETGIYSLKMSY